LIGITISRCLGDSFSNIYSFEPMGWGESAGFVELLGYYLGRSIERMVRNDGGAFATREMLQRELAREEDRLAGKRVGFRGTRIHG